MPVLFFLISLLASTIGAICGIGGGIIIKPTLDAFHFLNVPVIDFLSGCTVLSMTCYSVGRSLLKKEHVIDIRDVTPLAIGAATGGVIGKYLFSAVDTLFLNKNAIGSVQAIILFIITLGALLYTLRETRIQTMHVGHAAAGVGIGLALGVISSFLGIGGGPINLVVLSFFFSMDTKTAAQNSLYIILFSQLTNIIVECISGTALSIAWVDLIVMVCGGISGGIIGRIIYRWIDSIMVTKLFVGLMCLILVICLYNAWQYMA